MATKIETLKELSLGGLTLAPAQVLGGIRLVPVLRNEVQGDLRLAKRNYNEDFAQVKLPDGASYYSYVPHALVADWSNDGSIVSAFGTQIKHHKPEKRSDGCTYDFGFATARVMNKMRAREGRNRLRFLPLNISMEGFLALHFGGPNIAWEEYSRVAIRDGLGIRCESSVRGRFIGGLQDALRVFEMHPNQVGTLVFVADAMASVFIVPSPADYKLLHRTLITDFFGELIYIYGFSDLENVYQPAPMDPGRINSIQDIQLELSRIRKDWSELHQLMTTRLFGCPIRSEQVYKLGPFAMQRFITDLTPKSENHIGEYIVRSDGQIEYMKSFRLSNSQTRRAYLLKQLAESNWELEACAEKLTCTKHQLIYRLEQAGFGYLLHQHVLDAARASRRTDRKR